LQKYPIKLDDSCIEVYFTSDAIYISGKLKLEIRQRMVIVTGDLSGSEVYSIREGRKKVVYLHHSGVGLKCPKAQILSDVSSPLAHVKSTKTRLGSFVTILTPGQFFIDYLIVSDDALVVVIPGRREVIVERGRDATVLYII